MHVTIKVLTFSSINDIIISRYNDIKRGEAGGRKNKAGTSSTYA